MTKDLRKMGDTSRIRLSLYTFRTSEGTCNCGPGNKFPAAFFAFNPVLCFGFFSCYYSLVKFLGLDISCMCVLVSAYVSRDEIFLFRNLNGYIVFHGAKIRIKM